ncbi:MAG: hypothetical protein OXC62_06415 [Aestuariivita sp.]|nr:hypothetical protein [Aestuariivita sp.]
MIQSCPYRNLPSGQRQCLINQGLRHHRKPFVTMPQAVAQAIDRRLSALLTCKDLFRGA